MQHIMQHKRLKLSAFLLLGVGLLGLQAQVMFILNNEGVESSFTLIDITKVDFSSDNIKVATIDGHSNSYTLSDLRSLNFNKIISGIQTLRPAQATGSINLFPNPVIDVMNIQSTSNIESIDVIEIISMEGRIVFSEIVDPNSNVYQINISELTKGIYVCKLSNGLAVETIRFVKQ